MQTFTKYCLLLLCCALLSGCGSSGSTNVAGDADAEALEAYEQALAEADAMAAEDEEVEP